MTAITLRLSTATTGSRDAGITFMGFPVVACGALPPEIVAVKHGAKISGLHVPTGIVVTVETIALLRALNKETDHAE